MTLELLRLIAKGILQGVTSNPAALADLKAKAHALANRYLDQLGATQPAAGAILNTPGVRALIDTLIDAEIDAVLADLPSRL